MPVEPCNCSVAVVGVLVPSYVGACGAQHGNSLFEWVNAVVVAFVYYGMVLVRFYGQSQTGLDE